MGLRSNNLYWCSMATLAHLVPQAPYVEPVVVTYSAAAALSGPEWIDTSVLDFALR